MVKQNRRSTRQQVSFEILDLVSTSDNGFSRNPSFYESKGQYSRCNEVMVILRLLQRQVTTNLKSDRENWWIKRAEEVEEGSASGDNEQPLRFKRTTRWGTQFDPRNGMRYKWCSYSWQTVEAGSMG